MAKKKKKKHIFRRIIILLIVLGILGATCYLGFRSYQEVETIIKDVEAFEFKEPTEITDKIDLPTKIGEKIKIEWNSSNESYLSNGGIVTRPTFEEGDKDITMTGKITIECKEVFSKLIINILKKAPEDLTFTITIPKVNATPTDLVNSVLNKIILPTETFDSINLPNKLCYEGVNITWDSLNDAVLSDSGKVVTPKADTVASLKAIVECDGYSDERTFDIVILAKEKELVDINDNFDDQAKTSRYSDFTSTNGVHYKNARILLVDPHAEDNNTDSSDDINKLVPAYVRFRNDKEKNGSFYIDEVINPTYFSFKYKFSGSQKTESSKFKITLSTMETKGIEVIEVPIKHLDEFTTYSLDLSKYAKVSITVEFIDEWSSDTYFDIDEVIVKNNPHLNMLESWIINNTPTKVSKAVVLPITTIYGGELTWVSNNNALTSEGIVVKQNEPTKVTLTCKIDYLDEISEITIEVLVVGLNSSEAVEIFFIDIGKYGAGDCGESIYIKFGDTDIIVDAGDNFSDTGKAVVEAIQTRMQDDKIEYVIATHPDADHIGGMPTLFDAFQIENLIKFEGGYGTKKYDKFVESYTNEGCKVYDIGTDIVEKGLAKKFITINNDIYIDFVNTQYYVEVDEKGKPMESNGRSIVFVLNAYGTRVLFTGDADNAPNHPHLEQNYMNEVGNIDILKVVHHGTRNGCDLDYLDVIDPEMAIICNGNYLGNKHGHPTPRAISNLYKHDPEMKVYAITGGGTIDGVANLKNGTYKCSSEDRFNQRNGLITLTIDNNGYSATSEYFKDKMMEMKNTIYYNSILASGLVD